MRKYDFISALAKETAAEVVKNREEWMKYLTTAARLYKYPFREQLLIYAQRPDATACASIELWNERMHCWVNKGAKGIALLDEDDAHGKRLKYVFDVSDVHAARRIGRYPELWELHGEHKEDVIKCLEQTYGATDDKKLFEERLMEIAERIAADYYEELLPDLQYMIEDSFLEGLDEQNVGIRLRETLSDSISFTLLSACGADMQEYGSEFAFDFIHEFNSMDTLAVLGDAANELAKPVLLEIGRTIRAYNRSHEQEQSQNLTQKGLANISKIDYNALKRESESGHEEYIDNNQNSVERGNSNESDIRKERGLSDPDITGGHSAGGNGNEVRNDEGDLSEGEPQGRVLSVSSERDIERTPADDPEAGRGENGEADKPDGGNRGSDRTAQGSRSDALGSKDEQHSEQSRGSGIERAGLQPVTDTPLRGDTPEPTFTQLSLFPSFEEQVGTVAAAEASMKYTMPAAFSLPQNELETILRSGGGKQHSRKRIFAKYTEGRNAEQMVDFLKNEYGQTGKGFEINGNPVSVWFDEHGMSVGYGTQARETPIVTMDWEDVESHIRSMIENGTYMSASEAFLVDTQERNRVANQIFFFLRDGMDETPEELGLKAGNYPESEAKLMELLSTHEGREQLKNILEDAANRLVSGEAELKWRHVKSPEYLLSEIADLDRERQEFPLPDAVEVAQEDFITQDEIDYALGRGSGYEHGAFRIYEYFMEGHDQKEAVAFLKNEYGIGGGSGGLPGNDDSHNEHDGKGIRLEKGSYGNPYAKVLLNWNVVEKRLRELIKEDKYLSPQGKENYKAYKEEQAEKARQRELSRLEHGQRLECKKDIEALIAEKFNGFVLPRNTADEIIDKYGIDCVEFVLANTVTHFDYDGRFSQNNKDWAKGIVAENEWQNNDLILSTHPAVLDGFTNQARRYINVLREKEKEAQETVTIDGYECIPVDQWGSEKEKYLLGNDIEDGSFYYAQVNGKTFEYDHKPERSEVEDDYINAIAEEDIDRHEAEVFSRFEGTDGIAEPDETEPQQEFSQEKSQKLSWHVVHDADDEYGNPTQWSATLSEGVFLWIDKEAEGYAIYDTADTTRPALETFSTLQEAMDWGNELAESGRKAQAEFPDEKEQNVVTEQTEDELDSIDTQAARERLENGEADRKTEEMLSQVLTGEWEPLTPSSEEKQPASERQSAQERSVSAPDKSNAVNFHVSDDRLGEGSPKEKFQRNIAAIKMLEQIEGENRYATPEEQQVLSQYVGWGGLADAFDESKSNWSAEYHQLKELLSPEEYRMARESTLNAHYTSPVIIRQMYETLEKMGFSKGNVLEPSMGIGNFFGMMPDSMKESRLYGVELDSITGRIAKQLYPQADVQIKGFEKTDYPNDFFDVAIGNVPFGQYKVADKQYDKNNFLIHDYFFAKTLDKVRPGGVVAFITSKGTMDKASPEVRRYLAQRADLLGAVRLPNTAFKANAGTEVTSDILFFQKRDRMVEREPDWVHLGEDADGIAMNAYFAEHPEQIVGKMEMVSGPYGMESTCRADDSSPFEEQLAKALQNITGQIDTIDLDEELADDMSRQSIPADLSVKNFSYTVVDNEVYYRENSVMKPVEVSDTAKERIKGMVAIRNCTQELIDMQLEEYSDAAIKEKQAELNSLYDNFSKKYGLINSQTNKRAFNQDSSYCLLCSLEKLDDEGNFKGKADMFTKRTIKRAEVVTSVDTASEALAVSLAEKAKIDLDYMGELTGKDKDTLTEELRGVIFQNPLTDVWETADQYLSGNVREKLAIATTYAENHPEYAPNVQALTQVQPRELDASEIEVRIGATWIEPKYINDFMRDIFQTPEHLFRRDTIGVQFSGVTGEWNVKGKNADYGNTLVNMTYGTSRVNAYKILEDSLNLKDTRVYDTIEEDGKEKRVLNKKETMIASQKQEAIREAFKDWVFRDPERRQTLVAKYNELFNSTRPREYDGSHLKFPGMTPDMLKLPVPEAEYENVVLKPSEFQKDMVASLAERAEAVRDRQVQPYEDNMLKITNDGRKLALDQRLLNDMLPDEENSKAATCVEKAYEIWENTKEQKSAQLIFCDLSTPKGDGTFNVYEDIKNKLMEKGVPEQEIAFIHDANTELRKAELFAKVRSGQVRFLLGSTAKMGAGTNVQDRLIALHHLDVPWRPSDIEQQEGRILRQGNQNDKVKIFRYVTEGTFDSYSWQLIENKQKFIGQIMTSKSPVRSCEDVDEAALSYAEVKALATGNPYIKEKMDLDIQVSKLKLMKANHTSQKYRLEDNITQHYPHQIAIFKERIEGFTADMNKYAKNKPEDKEQFFMQVGGKSYTDKKEAGTAIIAMCKEIKGINASADVGEYLGFKLNVTFDSFNNKFVMNVKGAMSHPMEVGSDPLGNITRINNVLEAMPSQLEEAQMKLSNVKHQLETAKAEVDKPFPQEAELAEKLERLAELNSLLNMDEKGDDAIGMDDEAAEPEKPQETVKTVDNKRDEVADMPAKQSNLGKTAVGGKLSDRPAERTSLQEKLAAMKARVSGTPAGRDAADKTKKKEEIL